MNEDIVRRWNSVVGPDDEVTIVGDLAMGHIHESLFYAKEMNGTKRLLPGNHDKMFRCLGSRYAHMVEPYANAGIEVLPEEAFMVRISDVNHLVCHFPYNGESREDIHDRYAESRPTDNGMRLIHGHTHGKWRKLGRMVDVGVDAWGGYPVSYEAVAELFNHPMEKLVPLLWEPS